MTPYGARVLEHFRWPRNHQPLAGATASADGSNPLCGDRLRMEILVRDDVVTDAAFTANACALCTAAASLLTERVRGLSVQAARSIPEDEVVAMLDTRVPEGRVACATLPLRTLRSALDPRPA